MGFLVLFRRERSRSPFRDYLQALLRWSVADEIVLASGYVWESPSARGYHVSQDDVAQCLLQGGHRRVVTISGMHQRFRGYGTDYFEHYVDFVRSLRQAGVHVDPYVSRTGRWHAKVALALQSGNAVAAIVGSSNLTGPAYGINRHNFNNEADVVLWSTKSAEAYFLSLLEDLDLPQDDYIVGAMAPEFHQPSEQQRLDALLADLLSPDGIDPLAE